MPYCGECGAEYREGIEQCSECGIPLEPGSRPPEVFGPQWTPVAAFASPEEAALARGFLLEAGIAAEVVTAERRILPIHRVVTSEVVVSVPPDDAEAAKGLLQQAETGAVLLAEDEPTDVGEGGHS